jgi:hypothetical protein
VKIIAEIFDFIDVAGFWEPFSSVIYFDTPSRGLGDGLHEEHLLRPLLENLDDKIPSMDQLFTGDALKILKTLPAGIVHTA